MRRANIVYRPAKEHASNLSKEEVDSYASRAAEVLDFRPDSDIEALVHKLRGRVHYQDIFNPIGEDDTILVHGPSDFDIVLSSISSPRRDRFTIAHELGHYFLHSRQGQVPLFAARDGSDRAEWEANWFAGGFLMPETAFRKAYSEGNRTSMKLASLFAVSQPAAEVRMKVLGLSI